MLGFSDQVTVRYVGVYLATGAYVSNWAALNSYQANNITGQEFSHLTSLNTQLTISQPMEASGYSSRSNSMQRTGWCCWQLHCPTKGSSSLYHGGLDLHRVGIENRHWGHGWRLKLTYPDDRIRGRFFHILLLCQLPAKNWQEAHWGNGKSSLP